MIDAVHPVTLTGPWSPIRCADELSGLARRVMGWGVVAPPSDGTSASVRGPAEVDPGFEKLFVSV